MKTVLICIEQDKAKHLTLGKLYFTYKHAYKINSPQELEGYEVTEDEFRYSLNSNFFWKRRFIEVTYSKLVRLLYE